jgi:ribosomal protein S2
MVKLWVRILLKGRKMRRDMERRKKRPLPEWLRKKIERRQKVMRMVRGWRKRGKLFSFISTTRKGKKEFGLTLGKKKFYLPIYYVSPTSVSQTSLDQLINAGLHLGGRWNSEMSMLVLGKRHGLFLIDLSESLIYLRRGLVYLSRAVSFRLPVLSLLSGKRGYLNKKVKPDYDFFKTVGGSRYIPGTLSNYKSVKKTKELPAVVCIADSERCVHAIKECGRLQIPFFGLCDSEMDPRWFAFPVFGNNDGAEGTQLLFGLVWETVSLESFKVKGRMGRLAKKWQVVGKRR